MILSLMQHDFYQREKKKKKSTEAKENVTFSFSFFLSIHKEMKTQKQKAVIKRHD